MSAMAPDAAEDLKLLIRSRHPIVAIETADEERARALIRRVADDLQRPLFDWSVTTGLRRIRPTEAGGPLPKTELPAQALAFAEEAIVGAVYVFRDLGPHLKDASLVRRLRDLNEHFAREGSTAILVDGAGGLPESARRLSVPLDLRWPDERELKATIRQTLEEARLIYKIEVSLSEREVERLIQTLRGLTLAEVRQLVMQAIYDDYKLDGSDLKRLVEAKRELVADGGILEAIAVDITPDDLGGLDGLKAWLTQRRDGFSQRAVQFGLSPPRGILLLGVQGTGKSLCARYVAADWSLPLLRLDPGVLYQKWIGETESRLRSAIEQAEAMAPTVLWIDEIEKGLTTSRDSSADGGVSQRVLGTLLSWMQDHQAAVFLVATSNNVSQLPPELLRKGRFDELFFVDLPDAAARRRIFEIHLHRRGRDPIKFDLDGVAAAAEGFSGAEIEQVVVAALYTAFALESDIDSNALLAEIVKTRPLSVTMSESIEALRRWASARCVRA